MSIRPNFKFEHTFNISTPKKGDSNGQDSQKRKPGRKKDDSEPISKRLAQNRKAQRAFRERKESYIKFLEERVKTLEEVNKKTLSDKEELVNLLHKIQGNQSHHQNQTPHNAASRSVNDMTLSASKSDPTSSLLGIGGAGSQTIQNDVGGGSMVPELTFHNQLSGYNNSSKSPPTSSNHYKSSPISTVPLSSYSNCNTTSHIEQTRTASLVDTNQFSNPNHYVLQNTINQPTNPLPYTLNYSHLNEKYDMSSIFPPTVTNQRVTTTSSNNQNTANFTSGGGVLCPTIQHGSRSLNHNQQHNPELLSEFGSMETDQSHFYNMVLDPSNQPAPQSDWARSNATGPIINPQSVDNVHLSNPINYNQSHPTTTSIIQRHQFNPQNSEQLTYPRLMYNSHHQQTIDKPKNSQ